MNETRHDVITAITAAAGLFAVTFPPALLWARAEHLLPRVIRQAPRLAAVLLLILRLVLTPPTKGATHV